MTLNLKGFPSEVQSVHRDDSGDSKNGYCVIYGKPFCFIPAASGATPISASRRRDRPLRIPEPGAVSEDRIEHTEKLGKPQRSRRRTEAPLAFTTQ